MNRSVCRVMMGVVGLEVLGMTATLAGVQTDRAMAQTPDAGCALPSEPEGIPAAIDAAISGPADKDRACMKALLIPEARMMFVSLGADGTLSYRLETLDDWIARVKARGHAMLEEKQLKFHIERYGNIAHLWSSYALHSDGKQVARGINSFKRSKKPAAGELRASWCRPSRPLRRCPRNICRKGAALHQRRIAYSREQYESIGRLPLVKVSTISDSAIRCLPRAVASDRRVMCAALHQSIVRALSNWAA